MVEFKQVPPEKRELVQADLHALFNMLELAVRPRIIREFAHYVAGSDQVFARRLKNFRTFLDAITSISKQRRDEKAAVIARFITNPCHDRLADDTLEVMQAATLGMVHPILHAWFAALKHGVTTLGGQQWLRIDTLDEAMLPRSNPEAAEMFEKMLASIGGTTVLPDEARETLAILHNVLPYGHSVPEEIEAYFEAIGVIVVR